MARPAAHRPKLHSVNPLSVAGPNLQYQDSRRVLSFGGEEIRIAEIPDVRTLVNVTILLTVDSGSTTFTVMLPRVNLPAPPALRAPVSVAVDGITTTHHLSLFPGLQHGQQTFIPSFY